MVMPLNSLCYAIKKLLCLEVFCSFYFSQVMFAFADKSVVATLLFYDSW